MCAASVIFQGPKSFWKTKNTIEIIFVEHESFDVIEIIAYEQIFSKEAPRLFVNNSILISKLDSNGVPGGAHSSAGRSEEDVLKLKIAYLFNRIFISEYLPETKVFTIEIRSNFRDRDDELNGGVTCSKPNKLALFLSPFGCDTST